MGSKWTVKDFRRDAGKVIHLALMLVALVIAPAGFLSVFYICGYLMLFGGLADAINMFKDSNPVSALAVGISVLKIFFALPVGLAAGSAPVGFLMAAGGFADVGKIDVESIPPLLLSGAITIACILCALFLGGYPIVLAAIDIYRGWR